MNPTQIQQEELHILWANLRDFDSEISALRSTLSPCERARTERFYFPRDRNNYIIQHGVLRAILGGYTGRSPSSLNFTAGPLGKPGLETEPGEDAIHFNASYSGDMAVYGITRACPIGVDVEYVQPISDWEGIASEFLSQSETTRLAALPLELRSRLFFDFWTRKEALLNANGERFRNGDVLRALLPPALSGPDSVSIPRTTLVCDTWTVHSFSPRPDYIAAVAFRRPDLRIVCRSAPPLYPAGSEKLRSAASKGPKLHNLSSF